MIKNRKGFTLIELLAVITILGILMIVAIPAVSRTIENSRRNTFLSTAKQYANAVKTAFAADEVKCQDASENPWSATTLTDKHSFWIGINTKSGESTPGLYAYDNAKELVNQGGVSSWGNADVSGWIVGVVSQTPDAKGKLRQEVKYYIELVDANNRGIVFNKDGANLKPKESDQLERVDVAPSSATRSVAVNTTTMPAIAGSTANGGGKVYNHKCYLG